MAVFAPPMLTREQAVEIRVLARRGMGLREIARQTGLSRNTVRRYVRQPRLDRYGPRAPRPTKLDPFKAYIVERIEAARPRWIPATVLLRELRERGYAGVISQLKALVAPLGRGRRAGDPIRDRAGRADASRLHGGTPRRDACSRSWRPWLQPSDVRAVHRRRGPPTLCGCLRQAFEFFGGVPQRLVR
jgi:transposase